MDAYECGKKAYTIGFILEIRLFFAIKVELQSLNSEYVMLIVTVNLKSVTSFAYSLFHDLHFFFFFFM